MQHVSNGFCQINNTEIYFTNFLIKTSSIRFQYFKQKIITSYFLIFLANFILGTVEASYSMNDQNDFNKSLLDVSELLYDQYTNFSQFATDQIARQICDFPNKCATFHILNNFQLGFCHLKLSDVIWTSVWNNVQNLTSSIRYFHRCTNLLYELQFIDNSLNGKTILVSDLIMEYINSKSKCNSIIMGLIELDEQARQYLQQFQDIVTVHQSYHVTYEAKSTKEVQFRQCLKTYKNWLCSELFSKFALVDKNYTFSGNEDPEFRQIKYVKLPKCARKCAQVETDCPYFQPLIQNGGEPGFLCDSNHYHSGAMESLMKSEQCITTRYCCKSQVYQSRPEFNQKRTETLKSEASRLLLLLLLFPIYAIPVCAIFIYSLD